MKVWKSKGKGKEWKKTKEEVSDGREEAQIPGRVSKWGANGRGAKVVSNFSLLSSEMTLQI